MISVRGQHWCCRPRAPKNLAMPLAVTPRTFLNECSFIFTISIDYFLNNLQSAILIMEEECVLCEVETEILYVVQMKIIFPRIKRLVLNIGCSGSRVST